LRSGVGVTHVNVSFLFLSPQHYFLIVFGHDGQKPLELRTDEESECDEWVDAIQQARYTTFSIKGVCVLPDDTSVTEL